MDDYIVDEKNRVTPGSQFSSSATKADLYTGIIGNGGGMCGDAHPAANAQKF